VARAVHLRLLALRKSRKGRKGRKRRKRRKEEQEEKEAQEGRAATRTFAQPDPTKKAGIAGLLHLDNE
jgi:hypothetical protein